MFVVILGKALMSTALTVDKSLTLSIFGGLAFFTAVITASLPYLLGLRLHPFLPDNRTAGRLIYGTSAASANHQAASFAVLVIAEHNNLLKR